MSSLSLDAVNQYIDDNMSNFKDGLRDAVAIKSVSSTRENREDVIRMMEAVASRMENSLGMSVDLRDLGLDPNYPDGDVQLPPVILASLGNDPNKKTLCIYGHLDVMPAEMSDGWYYPPFELTIVDDIMYGRGSTDDKGPVLGWLNSIEAFQQTNTSIPMNLKFVLEGMEESGSTGLAELIEEEKDLFFGNVDFIAISDNYWLGTSKPCLTYGLRGIIYFHVKVNCADSDLHSGSHGGPVYEAMSDVVAMFSTLIDEKGNILIPHVNDSVRELTPEEDALYYGLDFDMNVYQEEIGVHGLTTSDEKIHSCDVGDIHLYPFMVTGKFSIRLVPDQEPEDIGQLVINHLNYVHSQRGSPNIMTPTYSSGASRAWLGRFENPVFEAGNLATLDVHNVEPDYTREGGSIPVVITLYETTGKDCVLIPMGRSDDGPHSQNEKLNITNFQAGMKLFAAYIKRLDELTRGTGRQARQTSKI